MAFLLLVVLFAAFRAAAESEPVPCHCEFSGESDTPGCRVYGQLGDGKLIPWYVASRACLDVFKIKDQAIDPGMLASMFPNPDGSGGSPSAFVNYLRFDDGSEASGIKAGFEEFFVESESQPGKMVLRDEIKVGGLSYVCSSQKGGNEGACWTAVRSYFSKDPGSSQMADVGRDLYKQQAVSREKEQSFARIRLCENGPTDECGDLSVQVQEVKAANPDKFCSAYGLGPAAYDYPRCDGNSSTSNVSDSKQDDDGEDGSSPACSALQVTLCTITIIIASSAQLFAFA